MTVLELKQALEKLDPNLRVMTVIGDGEPMPLNKSGWFELDAVKVTVEPTRRVELVF